MPHYSLSSVRDAALKRRIELDSSRAIDVALTCLGTMLRCYDFAEAVLASISEADWVKTVTLPERPHQGTYDVYNVEISSVVAANFGQVERNWYLKLRLYETLEGETVFLVSMHPAEHPVKTVARVRPVKDSSED